MGASPNQNMSATLETAWHEYEEFSDGIYGRYESSGSWSTLGSSLEELCRHGLRSLLEFHMPDTRRKKFKETERETFWRRFGDVEENAALSSGRALEKPGASGHIHAALAALHAKLTQEARRLDHFEEIMQNERVSRAGDPEQPEATTSGSGGSSEFSRAKKLAALHKLAIGAILVDSAPPQFPGILESFFQSKFLDFNKAAKQTCQGMVEEDSAFLDMEYNEDEGVDMTQNGPSHEADEMQVSSQNEDQDSGYSSGGTDVSLRGEDKCFEQADSHPLPDSGKMEGNLSKKICHGELAEVSGFLENLGLGALCEEAYTAVLYSELHVKIALVAADRYTEHVLPPLYRWIKMVPLRFLSSLLSSTLPTIGGFAAVAEEESSSDPLVKWKLRLELYAHQQVSKMRSADLFDIVVDYPESLPAIEDLRHCLAATGERGKMLESFRGALSRRLLTGAASTVDILHHYVNTIKSLRALDPSGVLLDSVGEPIREYLGRRRDTARCVVSWLTDDGEKPDSQGSLGADTLAEELSKGPEQLEEDEEYSEEKALMWQPDPVEAEAESRSRRSHDIIRLLVGLLGSQETLVQEVRTAMAEKLLSKAEYDTDREIHTLELIKLRFGEKSFHSCEVMLKDIADSKRINANVKREARPQDSFGAPTPTPSPSGPPAPSAPLFPQRDLSSARPNPPTWAPPPGGGAASAPFGLLDATVVSALFWPDLQEAKITLPAPVEHLLEEYARVYHELKAPRKLKWLKNQGSVKLELEFEDCTVPFTVSPLLANIILQFSQRPQWTDAQLATATGMATENVRRRISFWVNAGVLLETSLLKRGGTLYTARDKLGGREDAGSDRQGLRGDSEEALEELSSAAFASGEEPRAKEWALQESYVLGMLTTFGDGLPLDRIHNMLKMFMADPPYDNTLPQLQRFVNRMVAEEKLEQQDQMYKKHI